VKQRPAPIAAKREVSRLLDIEVHVLDDSKQPKLRIKAT
jgi:hypothetical protein